MPIKQDTQSKLKQLIDNCNDFEGKYYLLYLYESLTQSDRSAEEIEPVALHLIALIKNITDLKNNSISREKRLFALMHLSENYDALIKETGANGILYKSKQALLDLGGFIIGLITGTFGAVLGSLSLGLDDIMNFRLPTGLFIGALTGMLIGFIIGKRAPHTLFNESETRLIRHAATKLETTFESLFTSVNTDYVEMIKKEILDEYFFENKDQFKKFLEENQKYEILGIEAKFFSSKLKGFLGHHGFIKFIINDNHKMPKLIEMGQPSDKETVFSQRESREATGEQLVRMLAMDKILRPQYEVRLNNLLGFYNRYQAGINDCHTYIDKILLAVGEPVSQIKRFKPEDTFLGRFIGNAFSFFSPLPEKLQSNGFVHDPEQNTITTGAPLPLN